MRNLSLRNVGCFSLLCCLLIAWVCNAQEKVKASKKPKPSAVKKKASVKAKGKRLTSAMTIEKILAAPVAVDFTNLILRDIVKWLEEEKKIAVYLHEIMLEDEDISLEDHIPVRMKDKPLYFILGYFQLDWYVQENVLHITTAEDALSRMVTKAYKVGDLLDDGFEQKTLLQAVHLVGGLWDEDIFHPDSDDRLNGSGSTKIIDASSSNPDSYGSFGGSGSSYVWVPLTVSHDSDEDSDRSGSTEWRGDVLFIKQTYKTHRLIARLLMAIRKHGRRQANASNPPIPIHQKIEEKLQKRISVNFDGDIRLSDAIKNIAEQSQIKILFDDEELEKMDITTSQPVLFSLTLKNRKLATVLQLLLSDLDLTWVLRDGVIFVTTYEAARDFRRTVIFDVRNLCQNSDESKVLELSIKKMITEGYWKESARKYRYGRFGSGENKEIGIIIFLKPGTMIVRQNEQALDEISRLLKMYRKALRESKRQMPDVKKRRNKVITRYYRINTTTANKLMKLLPLLVQSDSWHLDKKIGSLGTISILPTRPNTISVKKGKTEFTTVHVPYSVLIIFQTDSVHKKIAKVIQRIKSGDPMYPLGRGGGLSGGGGGLSGRGGGLSGRGFFSIRQ